MKDFLTNSVFFGAVISLVAYEIGTDVVKDEIEQWQFLIRC